MPEASWQPFKLAVGLAARAQCQQHLAAHTFNFLHLARREKALGEGHDKRLPLQGRESTSALRKLKIVVWPPAQRSGERWEGGVVGWDWGGREDLWPGSPKGEGGEGGRLP